MQSIISVRSLFFQTHLNFLFFFFFSKKSCDNYYLIERWMKWAQWAASAPAWCFRILAGCFTTQKGAVYCSLSTAINLVFSCKCERRTHTWYCLLKKKGKKKTIFPVKKSRINDELIFWNGRKSAERTLIYLPPRDQESKLAHPEFLEKDFSWHLCRITSPFCTPSWTEFMCTAGGWWGGEEMFSL